jgi:hypothetical protein
MMESKDLIKEIEKAFEKEPSLKLDIVEIVSKIEPVTYEEANKTFNTVISAAKCFWDVPDREPIAKKALMLSSAIERKIGGFYINNPADPDKEILEFLNAFCAKVSNKDFNRMNVYLKLERKCSVVDLFVLREQILDRKLPRG